MKAIHSLIIIILMTVLCGCKGEEKSFQHYLANPDELHEDYNFCMDHPGAGVCHNVVKKYFKYQQMTGSSKQAKNNVHFRNIDEPIAE